MSRREWSALWADILTRTKFRRLSPVGRGALFTLWALAMAQDPEATWRSRDELLDMLRLDGFEAEQLDELVALRWVDVDPNGTHRAHDWFDHQRGAFVSAHHQAEAERKAAERAKERERSKESEIENTTQHKTRLDNRSPKTSVHVRTSPDGTGSVPNDGAAAIGGGVSSKRTETTETTTSLKEAVGTFQDIMAAKPPTTTRSWPRINRVEHCSLCHQRAAPGKWHVSGSRIVHNGPCPPAIAEGAS